ncbi:MAG: Transcriptional regulator, TetR family protein [Gemmatimonadetes bacterium]|nr:Transcriptional regulator, TetR family protein [Gemmatimonadota bacterium]
MNAPTTPPRKRDGEATRQRLLRAALDLYTTVGFRGTTTPAIASRAGVAEGTIYRHFTSKEHLLNEVYRSAQKWATGLLKEIEEQEKAARASERLQRVARRFLEAAERDPAALRMLLYNPAEKSLDDKSREAAREFRDGLQQMVASGKSDGLVRPGPADLWASAWLSLIALAAEKVASREWPPDHPHLQLLIDSAWDAVSAKPIAPDTAAVPSA